MSSHSSGMAGPSGTQEGLPCPPIDVHQMLERCMGSRKIGLLLLEKFETQLRLDLTRTSGSAGPLDVDTLRRMAHALKGAAGAIAAKPLVDAATLIEKGATCLSPASLAEAIAALHCELVRALDYLPIARSHEEFTSAH